MRLRQFRHIPFSYEINKKRIPIVEISYDDYEIFNQLYLYAKNNYPQVIPTNSQAFPNGKDKLHFRWMIIHGNQTHELVIACEQGCYRFIIKPKKLKSNNISGRRAVLELYKMMDKYSIDMSKYECLNGLKIKEEIESPLIMAFRDFYFDNVLDHVYHLDFNSSYASRIIEAYPELKEPYEELYKNRKNDNDKFKHVLTNSVGCFQSKFCPDWKDRHKSNPYLFSNLSKIAINGTRAKVLDMIDKLQKKGMCPVLTNTDGIWYISDKGPYHDENEGENLCQWKNDHLDCKFLMTSVGCYQYVENGKCKTVLRGLTSLDKVKCRENWKFGDIMNVTENVVYDFDDDIGVIEKYV